MCKLIVWSRERCSVKNSSRNGLNITLMTTDYDNFMTAMKTEKKDRYWVRTKRAQSNLLEFGISTGLARKLIYCYPVGVIERLIRTTRERQPSEPASYFLNGLKKSRMKHRPQRTPAGDEDT